ncbi:MAG: ATP-grasp domain-containing protein [Sedimentisphaerales bacterium]|nr:ATP-grasp domain-containing protein [Sedimentisphaerales bacterium]
MREKKEKTAGSGRVPERCTAGRAIITFSRGWQTLVATRSLGRRGVEVVTGDEYAMTAASFSKYSIAEFRYPNPTKEPAAFLDALEKTVIKHKPEDLNTPYVLMPIHKETYLIARHRERFEPHIRVPIPQIEHIKQVHNKGTLAAYAAEHGLPIPKTWIPENLQHFHSIASQVKLPAFVKLREAASGVGIRKVKTFDELVSTYEEFVQHFNLKEKDYPIIQQAVGGNDYCVTTLFNHGKMVASMTYRGLRAFPAERGATVMRQTVHAPEMETIAGKLLGSLGWHGVAEIDFRWEGTPQTQPQLIEVNPRFFGGLIQSVESGWDYPWLLFQLAVKDDIEPIKETRTDVRTETPILAFLATLQEIAENERGMAALSESWDQAKQEFLTGSKRRGIRKLFHGVKEYFDIKARFNKARELLEEHKDNIYDVLSRDDPFAALGVLYPLAVFLRHGKVNMELITGEGETDEDE